MRTILLSLYCIYDAVYLDIMVDMQAKIVAMRCRRNVSSKRATRNLVYFDAMSSKRIFKTCSVEFGNISIPEMQNANQQQHKQVQYNVTLYKLI
jgi:hypothetical protein